MSKILVCNICAQKFDNPIRENRTCGMRNANGSYCQGVITSIEETLEEENVLKCSSCGRVAHDMSLEGKMCSFRITAGQYCHGALRVA